jgi:hypothetical protein
MRRAWLLALVLAVLGIVYVAAWRGQASASRPTAQTAASRSADVASVSRSCPPPGPNAGATHIALIAMPAQAQAAKGAKEPSGAAVLNAIPAAPVTAPPVTAKKHPTATSTATATAPAKNPTSTSTSTSTATASAPAKHPAPNSTQAALPVTVSDPGTPATVTAPGAARSGGTAVTATGEMAEGFEAEQATADGMGTVSCAHPGSDMWYVGTGAEAGAPDIRLYLMNTGDMPASVDVSIITDAGQQNGLGGAITVASRQVVVENIAPFVRGSQALALHVQTSSGQVAASVWEGGVSDGTWLPQAAAPSTVLVIPGLTVASSAARLFVAVPGATDARFKVVAFTAQGRFPQFGSSPVDAPAAATSSFPLTSLGASAAALELISNVPITAGVIVPGAGIGSVTSAVAPVTEQGIVAGNPATRGVTVGLVLTAPAASARASIIVIPSGGTAVAAGPGGPPQLVTVQAGHTITVTVPRPLGTRQPFSIVITPAAGSGPLYAARVVTTGTGGLSAPVISLLPVPSALTVISLPSVQNSYSAILPQP